MSEQNSRRPGQRTLVVALGGNAIARAGDDGTITAQYRRATDAMRAISGLVCDGDRVVLTHGNGPVVGNIVLRGELARHEIPPTPLFIADADSGGGIGLMLQQVLGNELRSRGSDCLPVTVITQIVVDEEDPAFSAPTKPIGMHYRAEEAHDLERRCGWRFAEEPGRGWRRLVPSPKPRRIVEADAVSALLDRGMVPVAAGGGGVPVVDRGGRLEGIDAVIDKDWASAMLADAIRADLLIILMEADGVYADWGTPAQRRIERMSAAQAHDFLGERGLSKGSIGPKVAAGAWLAERGGETLICDCENLAGALEERGGTRIVG